MKLTFEEFAGVLRADIISEQIPADECLRFEFSNVLILYPDGASPDDETGMLVYRTPLAGQIRWILDLLDTYFLNKITEADKCSFFTCYTLALSPLLSFTHAEQLANTQWVLLEIVDAFASLRRADWDKIWVYGGARGCT